MIRVRFASTNHFRIISLSRNLSAVTIVISFIFSRDFSPRFPSPSASVHLGKFARRKYTREDCVRDTSRNRRLITPRRNAPNWSTRFDRPERIIKSSDWLFSTIPTWDGEKGRVRWVVLCCVVFRARGRRPSGWPTRLCADVERWWCSFSLSAASSMI